METGGEKMEDSEGDWKLEGEWRNIERLLK